MNPEVQKKKPSLRNVGRFLIILIFWPFFLSIWIWKKNWSKKLKVSLIASIWSFIFIVLLSSSTYKAGYKAGKEVIKQQRLATTNSTPIPTFTPIPTIIPTTAFEPTILPTPTIFISLPTSARKINKGSNSKSIKFYDTIEAYYKTDLLNGEPYTEYESDYIVDINIEKKVVQLGLRYDSMTENINAQDEKMIMIDFNAIKNLAEIDKSLVDPEYGTLRWLVLTYHDAKGIARGELDQMMIDSQPKWHKWN